MSATIGRAHVAITPDRESSVPAPSVPPLLTAREVAAHLGVTYRHVLSLTGVDLAATNLGTPDRPRFRYSQADVDRYVRSRRVDARRYKRP